MLGATAAVNLLFCVLLALAGFAYSQADIGRNESFVGAVALLTGAGMCMFNCVLSLYLFRRNFGEVANTSFILLNFASLTFLAFWTVAEGEWPAVFIFAIPYLLMAAALSYSLFNVPRPGICECGYDLAGNNSGVCPECGERIVAAINATDPQATQRSLPDTSQSPRH